MITQHPKTAHRLAVEKAMSGATKTSPLSAEQIAERAGVNLMQARVSIGNCVNTGLAYNLRGAGGNGLYVWGQRESEPSEPVNPKRTASTEPWKPAKFTPSRPGALDFLKMPHLINGETVPRTAPALIGSQPAPKEVHSWSKPG